MANNSKLLYVHGFASSSASAKAQQMLQWFAQHGAEDRIVAPDLPVEPRQAMALLDNLVQSSAITAVVGSSIAGFYGTWLAERQPLITVLIKRAVLPQR